MKNLRKTSDLIPPENIVMSAAALELSSSGRLQFFIQKFIFIIVAWSFRLIFAIYYMIEGPRILMVELGTCMWVIAGSNLAQTDVASAVKSN